MKSPRAVQPTLKSTIPTHAAMGRALLHHGTGGRNPSCLHGAALLLAPSLKWRFVLRCRLPCLQQADSGHPQQDNRNAPGASST